MILQNNTITVSREAVKKYGGLGAIILQELYNNYGETVVIDVPQWRIDCLDYIPEATIKRILTELSKDGKIKRDETNLYILDAPPKRVKTEPKVKEKDTKENPIWEMAVLLCEIVGQAKNLQTPQRYLPFAKQLINDGRTHEFIKNRYGLGGWWYKTQYKGTLGQPPRLDDIRTTLDKVSAEIKPATTVKDKSNDFFR